MVLNVWNSDITSINVGSRISYWKIESKCLVWRIIASCELCCVAKSCECQVCGKFEVLGETGAGSISVYVHTVSKYTKSLLMRLPSLFHNFLCWCWWWLLPSNLDQVFRLIQQGLKTTVQGNKMKWWVSIINECHLVFEQNSGFESWPQCWWSWSFDILHML